ncbi:MAG: hypothetical protein V4616_03090 [Bacteroidota bacterium]
MTPSEWIGAAGVTLLLVAYLLNVINIIKADSVPYLSLNIIGAGMTCYSSILIHFIPFVVLEAVWTLVSLVSLIKVLFSSPSSTH